MGYGLEVTSAPVSDPITLAEAKSHLNVSHSDDDGLILRLIQSACQQTEVETGRCWMQQTVTVSLMRFPCCDEDDCSYQIGGRFRKWAVQLPLVPVSAVNAVRYYDAGGTLRTLSVGTDWIAWLSHLPPVIFPAPAKFWPEVQCDRPGAVEIECVAGYASADVVPAMAKSAMLLAIGYWYEHRGDSEDPSTSGLPEGAIRLRNLLSTGSY